MKQTKNLILLIVIGFLFSCSSPVNFNLIKNQTNNAEPIYLFYVGNRFLLDQLSSSFNEEMLNTILESFSKFWPEKKIFIQNPNLKVLYKNVDYSMNSNFTDFDYKQTQFNKNTILYKETDFQIHQESTNNEQLKILILIKIESIGFFKKFGNSKEKQETDPSYKLFLTCDWVDLKSQKVILRNQLAEFDFSPEELAIYENLYMNLQKVVMSKNVFESFKKQVKKNVEEMILNIKK